MIVELLRQQNKQLENAVHELQQHHQSPPEDEDSNDAIEI